MEIGFTVNDKGYNVLRNIRMATASHEEPQQEITIEKVYAKLLSIEQMLHTLKG